MSPLLLNTLRSIVGHLTQEAVWTLAALRHATPRFKITQFPLDATPAAINALLRRVRCPSGWLAVRLTAIRFALLLLHAALALGAGTTTLGVRNAQALLRIAGKPALATATAVGVGHAAVLVRIADLTIRAAARAGRRDPIAEAHPQSVIVLQP